MQEYLQGLNKSQSKPSKNTISDSVGSYEKHPFFIKKASTAKALLLKVCLPKELAKKSHA